jgi:hypothetical protein
MPWPFTATETVLLITTTATAIGTTVGGLVTLWYAARAKSETSSLRMRAVAIEGKVDEVRLCTNSHLSQIVAQLNYTQRELASALAALAHAETVRVALVSGHAMPSNVSAEKAVPPREGAVD